MRIGILGNKEFVVSRHDMLTSIVSEHASLISHIEEIDWSDSSNVSTWATGTPESIQDLDVLLISVPAAYMYSITEMALRNGLHAYLCWNSSISISEYQKLSDLAEEAGSELGIDLPMQYHPLFDRISHGRSASVLSIRRALHAPSAHNFQSAMEESIELCYQYGNRSEVQRIDAHVVRSTPTMPDTLLASIKFQNGTFVHLHIHQPSQKPIHTLFASGSGFSVEVDLEKNTFRKTHHSDPESQKENGYTQSAFEESSLPAINLDEAALTAFISAIAEERPVPVSIFDGLQTKRIIEKLRKSLR